MGSYTAVKTFEFEFDGDQISCSMTSPSVATIKKMSAIMKQGKSEGEGDLKFSMSMEDSMVFMEEVAPHLKEAVTAFSGCKDSEGSEMSLDKVLGSFYFLNLVGILISNMFTMGEVSKDDTKKSPGTSTTASKVTSIEPRLPTQ